VEKKNLPDDLSTDASQGKRGAMKKGEVGSSGKGGNITEKEEGKTAENTSESMYLSLPNVPGGERGYTCRKGGSRLGERRGSTKLMHFCLNHQRQSMEGKRGGSFWTSGPESYGRVENSSRREFPFESPLRRGGGKRRSSKGGKDYEEGADLEQAGGLFTEGGEGGGENGKASSGKEGTFRG